MSVGAILFAVGLVLSWVNSAMHVAMSERPLYAMSRRVFQGPVRRARGALVLLLSAVFVAQVVAFTVGWNPEWVAITLLLSLFGVRQWEKAQWPGDIVVYLGKYVAAAACLAAWLVAQPVLRLWGYPAEEARHLGWDAACGVMAGAFTLAGLTKLREAGVRWLEAKHHALLIAERAFSGPMWLRRLRLAVARSPHATQIIGVYGMAVELGAIAFVVPELRVAVLVALWALLIGFVVLLGYFEVEWATVALAVMLLAR